MTTTITPVTEESLQQAIDVTLRIFGDYCRKAINQEFKAALGHEPERRIVSSGLYINGDSKFFLAHEDGKLAGVTGHYTIKGHEEDVWLGWTGVLQGFQGRGVGNTLIQAAFKDAVSTRKNVQNFRIWTTVEEEYANARKLYTKMGFVEEIYKPQAQDAGKLVVVFSQSAKQGVNNDSRWVSSPYSIDCERDTIPYLNKKSELMAQNDNKQPLALVCNY